MSSEGWSWNCPLPLRDYPNIVLGHGGGGKLSAELTEHLFLPAFRNEALESLADAAVIEHAGGRLAFTTDSFVVSPIFFPGGSIGELAVNGTVNDLAMVGAKPLYLSAGFILEEGFPIAELAKVVDRMAAAAAAATVRIVCGDTKVVDRGHGHGCYINTAGVGHVPDGVQLRPSLARPGDVVLLSGTIGDHGMAVMSVREGLAFDSVIESDCAPLHQLVESLLEITGSEGLRVLRDPTRGGLAAALNEIASASNVGILIDEERIPVRSDVRAACDILGLDPLHVANEGKLVAIVDAEHADEVLKRMKSHPAGVDAASIGTVQRDNPGILAAKTAIGGTRVVTTQIGEQLPRIC
jgi:hydrogenase expression/formation protein HypE